VSTIGDALAAIKPIVSIEERGSQQSAKLEKLADLLIDVGPG
jgi:hypothetical protein